MISIVIPVHNEEKRLRESHSLEEYASFFERLAREKKIDDFEILAVLNACKDNTIGLVKSAEKKHKKIKHIEFKQGGKGFAVIEGFREALRGKGEIIGFVDADNATSPQEYYKLIKGIEDYDGVIASRYVAGAVITPKRTFARLLASRVFNFLVRALFLMPYRDTQCGAKIFRREALEKVISKIGITRWAFDVDLLYQLSARGFRIKEQATSWHDKEYSKINLGDAGPSMFLAIVRLRIINSPFRDFVRLWNSIFKK
jgi:glycosyltransferase involved in cell wall biosynthesis